MSRSERAAGVVAHHLSSVRRRTRLIRSARLAGSSLYALVWTVNLTRALLPTAAGLATGWLVAGLLATPHDRAMLVAAAVTSCVLTFAGQAASAFGPAVAFSAARRIDARHRDRVAELVGRPVGIAHLEDPSVQDALAAATMKGLPGWASYTFGTAAVGQIVLVTRIAGSCAATAVLARFSWAWALSLLALTLVVRSVTQREWLAQHEVVRGLAPATRRAAYWADVAVLPRSAKEVRTFGMGDWIRARFLRDRGARAEAVAGVHLRLMRRTGWTSLLLMAAVAAVLVALATDTARGVTDPGALAVHLGALWGVVAVHGLDVESFDVRFAGLPTLDALDALEERVADSEPRPPTTSAPRPRTGASRAAPRVRFEGVDFRYPSSPHPVFQGLDLEIAPRELLAVVGANGAGKTTLTKLLTGMYAPDAGRVTVDGVPLSRRDVEEWRSRIALVSQDFIRYDLSLRQNVLLGAPTYDAKPGLLAKAATRAGIDDLVSSAPHGWDTPLTPAHEGGVDLSGGQWQRVALARAHYALARGAGLLILDEPTAHLDVRAELAVFEEIAATAGDFSVVLISHRLATVRRADRILLLDGGRVTESGTHDELVARGGTYAEMFAAQADRFDTAADTEVRGR